MGKKWGPMVCTIVVAWCCGRAFALTLTFEDIPPGQGLDYYKQQFRVTFSDGFAVQDHTGFSWGPPRSGANVLVFAGEAQYGGRVLFGEYSWAGDDPDDIRSVGAYFSTQTGVMVSITAYYGNPGLPVGSVVIGAPGESWNNRYVEIRSPYSPFYGLQFEGVNSPEELWAFCADDMTVVPVPEPGSVAGLGLALIALSGGVLRRRQ